jgi:DNA-binding transcriptional ArsR family regulator
MDPIDEEITSTMRDGKHMTFGELLSKLSVSHNTLRLHLDAMAEKGEIMKEKRPSKTRGRPGYFYSTVSGPVRRSSPLVNRVTGVVSLGFERLSQICRFEKGGWCKKLRGRCYSSDCPQIR